MVSLVLVSGVLASHTHTPYMYVHSSRTKVTSATISQCNRWKHQFYLVLYGSELFTFHTLIEESQMTKSGVIISRIKNAGE